MQIAFLLFTQYPAAPIGFMSRKMNAAETRYPVHEQELLAIVEHYNIGIITLKVQALQSASEQTISLSFISRHNRCYRVDNGDGQKS